MKEYRSGRGGRPPPLERCTPFSSSFSEETHLIAFLGECLCWVFFFFFSFRVGLCHNSTWGLLNETKKQILPPGFSFFFSWKTRKQDEEEEEANIEYIVREKETRYVLRQERKLTKIYFQQLARKTFKFFPCPFRPLKLGPHRPPWCILDPIASTARLFIKWEGIRFIWAVDHRFIGRLFLSMKDMIIPPSHIPKWWGIAFKICYTARPLKTVDRSVHLLCFHLYSDEMP